MIFYDISFYNLPIIIFLYFHKIIQSVEDYLNYFATDNFRYKVTAIGGYKMTEPIQPGNKKLPDFKELNDRLITEQSTSGPTLVIKTNLDPKDSTVDNPYFQNVNKTDKKAFRDYFE